MKRSDSRRSGQEAHAIPIAKNQGGNRATLLKKRNYGAAGEQLVGRSPDIMKRKNHREGGKKRRPFLDRVKESPYDFSEREGSFTPELSE